MHSVVVGWQNRQKVLFYVKMKCASQKVAKSSWYMECFKKARIGVNGNYSNLGLLLL